MKRAPEQQIKTGGSVPDFCVSDMICGCYTLMSVPE